MTSNNWAYNIHSDNYPFEFIWVKDSKNHYLRDYYNLRKQLYENGGDRYKGTLGKGKIDQFDNPNHPNSHILLCIKDGKCIGGGRIITKLPGDAHLLPSEGDMFSFEKSIKNIPLKHLHYGELSRLALIPEYSGYIEEIYILLLQKSQELCLSFLVGTATLARCVIYKRIAEKYGNAALINKNSELPDEGKYDNVKMYIIILDVINYYKKVAKNNGIYENEVIVS
ncbi:MAG: hypothetical protein IPP74_08265 [Alphaproteobacteria bacterium]|nr:hypothetical protein [Alphaproteobacteria bacterium]